MLSLLKPVAAFATIAIFLANTADAIPSLYGRNDLSRNMSNGYRLARGLPLKKPIFHRPGQLRARASPTITTDPAPTTSAAPPPPPAPASTCTDTSGRISVKSADGQMDGYISAALSSFGEYGLTSDTDAALIVNTCVFPDGTYELRSLNGAASEPFFGAVLGTNMTDSNMGTAGSVSYAILVGVPSIPLGPAITTTNSLSETKDLEQLKGESAIWSLGADNSLTARWTKDDNSVATDFTLAYFYSGQGFQIISDYAAYVPHYGPSDVVQFFLDTSNVTQPIATGTATITAPSDSPTTPPSPSATVTDQDSKIATATQTA